MFFLLIKNEGNLWTTSMILTAKQIHFRTFFSQSWFKQFLKQNTFSPAKKSAQFMASFTHHRHTPLQKLGTLITKVMLLKSHGFVMNLISWGLIFLGKNKNLIKSSKWPFFCLVNILDCFLWEVGVAPPW